MSDSIASDDLVRRLRAQCSEEGEPVVAKRMGVGRHSLVRVLAMLPVRMGTIALVERGMAASGTIHHGVSVGKANE